MKTEEYIKQLEEQNTKLMQRCAYLEALDDIINFAKNHNEVTSFQISTDAIDEMQNMFGIDMNNQLIELAVHNFLEVIGNKHPGLRKHIQDKCPNTKFTSWT
jgi:uncharacterized protein with HEPN domain